MQVKNKIFYPVFCLLVLTVFLLVAVNGRAMAQEGKAEVLPRQDSVLSTGAAASSGPAAGTGFSVKLNGRPVTFDVPPRLESGRFLIPLRPVLEAMGAKVSWSGETGTAVACLPGATLAVTAGSQDAGINGREWPMPVAA